MLNQNKKKKVDCRSLMNYKLSLFLNFICKLEANTSKKVATQSLLEVSYYSFFSPQASWLWDPTSLTWDRT